MRLLVTTDTVGGVWTYTVELAHALAPYGVDVHAAVLGRAPSPAQEREATVFAGVHHLDVPLEWMPDPWAGVDASGAWLLELQERLAPDVVQLGGYAHAALPWRAPTVVVAHSDVLSWWRAVHGVAAPAQWGTYAARVAAGLAAAGRVVAPTAAVEADLAASYGFTDAVVVANCRRAQLFPPADKEPFVLAAGRVWDAAKGLDALAGLDLPVVVAGEGELPGVTCLGPLDTPALADLMGRATVFAAPARYEPFGLAVLEAAHAGCALVLADLPGFRELWGDTAVYVRDRTSWRGVLLTALTGPDRGARERAAQLSPQRLAAGMLEVYRSLPAAVR